MRTIKLLVLVFVTAILNVQAQVQPELAKTPPMGWNSWNWFGKHDINEDVIKKVIDAMVDEGLRDAGYNYVVVDGGWRDTKLGVNGELLAHPTKFPSGIKALADYAHSKGMKFGVHVVPGTHDCGGDAVGAIGKEEVHLKQFEEWGLDFIKLDQCRYVNDPCETCPKLIHGWSEPNSEEVYKAWSSRLKNSTSNILFSISAYKFRNWYPAYCNMARTTGDIQSRIHRGGAYFNPPSGIKKRFHSVMEVVEINNKSAEFAGNGYWNDPDMMVTGVQGLSLNEQESHFALWCMMSAPLFLGNDPGVMSEFEKELLLNKEMITVNQDPTEQGKIIKRDKNTQIWTKKLKNNKLALMFLNLDVTGQQEINIGLKELGINNPVNVRDAVNHKDLGTHKKTITYKLNTNQCKLMILSE